MCECETSFRCGTYTNACAAHSKKQRGRALPKLPLPRRMSVGLSEMYVPYSLTHALSLYRLLKDLLLSTVWEDICGDGERGGGGSRELAVVGLPVVAIPVSEECVSRATRLKADGALVAHGGGGDQESWL
jgi:hypothetical protein